MDQLWSIALRANNTDVSMTAIQILNNYYINYGNGHLEKEAEFIQRCMDNLTNALTDIESVSNEQQRKCNMDSKITNILKHCRYRELTIHANPVIIVYRRKLFKLVYVHYKFAHCSVSFESTILKVWVNINWVKKKQQEGMFIYMYMYVFVGFEGEFFYIVH